MLLHHIQSQLLGLICCRPIYIWVSFSVLHVYIHVLCHATILKNIGL